MKNYVIKAHGSRELTNESYTSYLERNYDNELLNRMPLPAARARARWVSGDDQRAGGRITGLAALQRASDQRSRPGGAGQATTAERRPDGRTDGGRSGSAAVAARCPRRHQPGRPAVWPTSHLGSLQNGSRPRPLQMQPRLWRPLPPRSRVVNETSPVRC